MVSTADCFRKQTSQDLILQAGQVNQWLLYPPRLRASPCLPSNLCSPERRKQTNKHLNEPPCGYLCSFCVMNTKTSHPGCLSSYMSVQTSVLISSVQPQMFLRFHNFFVQDHLSTQGTRVTMKPFIHKN